MPPTAAPPPPTANLSLTDRATLVALLTTVAGVVTAAWPGHDMAPFIQPIALAIAGVAPVVLIFSKHHYAQGIVTGAGVIQSVSATLPATVSPQIIAVAAQAAQAAADAAQAVSATLAGLTPATVPPAVSAGPAGPAAPIPPPG